jgi:TRAP-type mannitol/chloroaromatic compound transport system permease small subunit
MFSGCASIRYHPLQTVQTGKGEPHGLGKTMSQRTNALPARAGPKRLVDVLESIVDAVGRWIAWSTLAIVLVVAIDVILRYLFRVGSVAMQEIEWHLMSPIALIGMSYTMRHNEHVRVDLFYERLSPKARVMVEFVGALITIAISIVLIQMSIGFVAQAYASGESSTDPGGLPYRYLLKAFIPVGFALLLAQAVAQALRHGLTLMGGRADG